MNRESAQDPAFQERAIATKEKTQAQNADILFGRIQQYAFAGQTTTAAIPAPTCEQQRQFKPIYGSGPATQYQHTFEQQQP